MKNAGQSQTGGLKIFLLSMNLLSVILHIVELHLGQYLVAIARSLDTFASKACKQVS